MSLHCAVYYFCWWLCLCMTSYFTFLILCIYVGLNQLFYGFKMFHNTNIISPAFSINTFEFQFLYIIFHGVCPDCAPFPGTPPTGMPPMSGYGPYLHTCLKYYFYLHIPLIHIHYNFKCCRYLSQLVLKPCSPTSKLTQFMPLEAKWIISDDLLWLYEIKFT